MLEFSFNYFSLKISIALPVDAIQIISIQFATILLTVFLLLPHHHHLVSFPSRRFVISVDFHKIIISHCDWLRSNRTTHFPFVESIWLFRMVFHECQIRWNTTFFFSSLAFLPNNCLRRTLFPAHTLIPFDVPNKWNRINWKNNIWQWCVADKNVRKEEVREQLWQMTRTTTIATAWRGDVN